MRSLPYDGKTVKSNKIFTEKIPFSVLADFVDEVREDYSGNPFFYFFTVSAYRFDSRIDFTLTIDMQKER